MDPGSASRVRATWPGSVWARFVVCISATGNTAFLSLLPKQGVGRVRRARLVLPPRKHRKKRTLRLQPDRVRRLYRPRHSAQSTVGSEYFQVFRFDNGLMDVIRVS